MAIHKLTAAQIAKLTRDGMYGDGGGLWLQIRNGGTAKSWLFRWTEPTVGGSRGRDRVMGLGAVYKTSMDEARELAKAQWQLVKQGLDPIAVRDGVKLDQAIKAGRTKTFNEVADEWFEAKMTRKAEGTRRTAVTVLRTVRAAVGRRPIQKIDTDTILKEVGLNNMWHEKNPSAKHLISCLTRIFSYAIAHNYYVGKNPAPWKNNLEHALDGDVHRVVHFASLPHREIGSFMEALRSYRGGGWALRSRSDERPTITLLLEFIILTGCRISEARLATWDEIDTKNAVWAVPYEHHKTGGRSRQSILRPITSAMQNVLDEMQRRQPDHAPDALIFPSQQTRHPGPMPYSITSFQAFLRRSVLKWPAHLTAHGFRSTFIDWCRERGHPKELYDMQVGHAVGDKTDQAYARGQLVDPRRPMMEAWGQYCSQLAPEPIEGTNIESLAEWKRTAK